MKFKKHTLVIIGIILILVQINLFRNFLPLLSNVIIVKGQHCTCPHAKVTSGIIYLINQTPDSLKQYNLEYSEIYFTNEISTNSDPMGKEEYVIFGKIVGKESVSENEIRAYPLFQIEKYYTSFNYKILKCLTSIFLVLQILGFAFLILRNKRLKT